jgi:hypothetical protein
MPFWRNMSPPSSGLKGKWVSDARNQHEASSKKSALLSIALYSIAVDCCWPSLAQSFLVLGPVGTYDQIFVHSKNIYMFENRSSSSARGGLGPSE